MNPPYPPLLHSFAGLGYFPGATDQLLQAQKPSHVWEFGGKRLGFRGLSVVYHVPDIGGNAVAKPRMTDSVHSRMSACFVCEHLPQHTCY